MHKYDELEMLYLRLLKADKYFLSQGFIKLKNSENKQKVEELYAEHSRILDSLTGLSKNLSETAITAIMDDCENKFKKENENVKS
jgi:hypothetical protein